MKSALEINSFLQYSLRNSVTKNRTFNIIKKLGNTYKREGQGQGHNQDLVQESLNECLETNVNSYIHLASSYVQPRNVIKFKERI